MATKQRMPPVVARYIDISGTWSVRNGAINDWNGLGSPFTEFRRQHGLAPWIMDPKRSFQWSTNLNGIPGDGGHEVWRATARSLANYIISPWTGEPAIAPSQTNMFTHSHGLQPVLIACAEFDLKIDTLIDVAGPVRDDLMDVAHKAKKNIRQWLHLYAGMRDLWQLAGELFDGFHLGMVRQHPCATVNAKIPGGHGTILRDPSYFHYWIDQGWFGWMTTKP